MMDKNLVLRIVLSLSMIFLTHQAKRLDPYKVLGVDQEASQREIQKAFHKLSLQYHPDKNQNKGAQEKFSEINNAYEILGDEQKRKNYDTYGDENGQPGFHTGYPGDHGGYSYFTGGDWGQNGYSFRSDGAHSSGQGRAGSFSFSFGGPSSGMPFDFGMNDFFNMFGGGSRSQYSSYSESSRSESSSHSGHGSATKRLKDLKPESFKKDISKEGITYLILAYTPTSRELFNYESIVQEVSESMRGALKSGKINCQNIASLCDELEINPQKAPRIVIFSYKAEEEGSLVEYKSELVAKKLKTFCQDNLPAFSKRMDLKNVDSISSRTESLPAILLLSSKRDTPTIWRVLSGLYNRRFTFFDTQVDDVGDPIVKGLEVSALPAVVGWSANGDKHVIKSGIPVKDLKTTVDELRELIDEFENKYKMPKHPRTTSSRVPLLTRWNFDTLCGEESPVCIIGAFRSSKAKKNLQFILSEVSQKSLARQQIGGRDSVAYVMVDASKHPTFLEAFDKKGFKTADEILFAYKPRKSKYVTLQGDKTMEEVESFIASVLNGDLRFNKTNKAPVMK